MIKLFRRFLCKFNFHSEILLYKVYHLKIGKVYTYAKCKNCSKRLNGRGEL